MAINIFRKKQADVLDQLKDEPAVEQDDGKRKRKPKKVRTKGKIAKILLRVFILLLIVAIGVGGYLIVRFDYFGIRTWVVEKVNTLDPQYASLKKNLEDEIEKNRLKELELLELEKQLNDRAQELANTKHSLDTRAQELDIREASRIPIYRQPLSDEDLANMTSLSLTYSKMDPAEAARILATLGNIEDMTAIIYYMSERNAAAILAQMDVRLAAQITDLLLVE